MLPKFLTHSDVRNQDIIKDMDVSDLCDEVLLSPEESTYINWDNVIDFGDRENVKDTDGRLSFLPAIEHLFIRNIDNLDKVNFSETQEMLLESLRKKTHNRAGNQLDQYWCESDSSLRHALPKRTMKKDDKEIKYLDSFLSGASKRGKADFNEMTPRQKFWMRSSRSRWRRKVASADTSPEDPRRMRFTRGSSIEDRKSSCFNDTDDFHKSTFSFDTNISISDKPKTSKLQNVPVSCPNFHDQDAEEASPPSPHGMYTWPPQHVRHKHHGSFNEEDPEIYNHNIDFDDEIFQQENETPYSFRPRSNMNSIHRPESSNAIKESKIYEAESQANLKRKSFLTKKIVHRSLDYSDSSDTNDDLETSFSKTSSSYTNIRSIFNKYPESSKAKESAIFSYPSRTEEIFDGESLNANQKTTLSLLLSAKPISSLNSHQTSNFISRDLDVISNHEETEEDLYAVHKIPPTKARRDSNDIEDGSPRSCSPPFMQERSDRTYHRSRIFPGAVLSNVYLGEEHYHAPLSSHSADSSYKEIRYHLAAAAAAAEQEWIESRRHAYRNLDQMNYDTRAYQNSPDGSPSYMVMDSAEFAPWSSPSAYPVGPLGASWLKHGFQSHTNHSPYHFPAPLVKSHSFSSRSFSPSFSPQWYPTNHSSLHSLSSLDPSTDEFLIDAGIRIDESLLYNNISATPSYSSSCKTRNKLSNSRIRPPSVSSKIPVVGRIGDTSSNLPKKPQMHSGSMKTRAQAIQRPSRPVSGVSHRVPLTPSNVIGSRGKSLSHENLRSSSRLVLMSSPSSAQTSPTTSRPVSPISSGSSLRSTNSNPRVQKPQIVGGRSRGINKPSSCGSSPSGSRCSSPGSEESKGRRANIATSSSVSLRCSPPGRDDPPKSINQRRVESSSTAPVNSGRNRPSSSIPMMMSKGKGSGSKLPLPTSRK